MTNQITGGERDSDSEQRLNEAVHSLMFRRIMPEQLAGMDENERGDWILNTATRLRAHEARHPGTVDVLLQLFGLEDQLLELAGSEQALDSYKAAAEAGLQRQCDVYRGSRRLYIGYTADALAMMHEEEMPTSIAMNLLGQGLVRTRLVMHYEFDVGY